MNTKYNKYFSLFVVLVAFLLFKFQNILATKTTSECEDNIYQAECTLKKTDYVGTEKIIQMKKPDRIDKKIYDVAHLDIDAATPEKKLEILEARNIIIRSSEWVPDGCEGWVENVETGEIIQRVPTFSELFPEWDIPIFDDLNFKTSQEIPIITVD